MLGQPRARLAFSNLRADTTASCIAMLELAGTQANVRPSGRCVPDGRHPRVLGTKGTIETPHSRGRLPIVDPCSATEACVLYGSSLCSLRRATSTGLASMGSAPAVQYCIACSGLAVRYAIGERGLRSTSWLRRAGRLLCVTRIAACKLHGR